MKRPQLNFAGLRARQLDLFAKTRHFTRRGFIGLTGTAALGAASQVKQLGRVFDPLEIRGDENRLAFLLNGEERWVIDPKQFGGSPRLAIEKSESRIQLQLSHATYPGTKLPADLTCELNRAGRHWRMRLRMALGGFNTKVPFERWLAGDEPAASTVRLDRNVLELGHAARVLVSGSARATFDPGWVTGLRGARLVRLLGAGDSLLSNSITISLLDHEDASFIDQPAAKRTLVSIERGKREWRLENSILPPPGAQLESINSPFDALHVEAGESRNGALTFAMVAEPRSDDIRLSFYPSNEFKGVFGEPFRLGLRSAILAATFDHQGHERFLLAQFGNEPVWFQGEHFVVELGDAPDEVPFALVNRDGHFAKLRCAPALRSAAFHFAGAVVQPSPCPDGSRLIFDAESGDGALPAEFEPSQRPTPTPTPRRVGPVRIPPTIVVRPTPTPTPIPPRRPQRPTPTPTPPSSGFPPGARPPQSTATPRPTPAPTPPSSGFPPGSRPPSTRPTPRPTPEPTPTPSSFPPGSRPPSTQPIPTPTPRPTPGRPVFIPPGVLRPRPTPTPEGRPTPPPRETPTPEPSPEPSTGVVSTRPETLGDLKLHGTFSTVVIRPEDLLVLRLEFINFLLETGPAGSGGRRTPQLVRDDTGRPSYIAVHLQAQNIAEQAFFETASDFPVQTPPKKPVDPDAGKPGETPTGPPVRARLAGPSRLVFRVPNNTEPIDYTLASILEKCGKYQMSVVPHALPPKSTTKFVMVPGKYLINAVIDKPGLGVKAFRLPSSQQIIQQARVRAMTSVPGKDLVAIQKEDKAIKDVISSGQGPSVRPPKPRAPNPSETALELPYLLILSPSIFGGWAHSPLPVTSQKAKRTELWHTRLGVRSQGRVDEESDALRTVRAIWALDPGFHDEPFSAPAHENEPFRMSLDAYDRYNIVHLSSNYTIFRPATEGRPTRSLYDPEPVNVERLMLSSLGAWINSRGAWESPIDALSVEEWRQRGTMGRDHYVRVVYKGYLFPFGHRASLVKITERKFHKDTPGNVAYLRQRMFIVVREPEKTFGGTGLENSKGHSYDRQMPFRRVRLTTLVTPNLDDPQNSDLVVGVPQLQSLFWPRVGDQDFQFHIVAEDFEGNEIELTQPLLFADSKAANDAAAMQAAQTNFETGFEPRRKRDLRGQKMMLADSAKPGDTSFETQTITFGAEIPTLADMGKLEPDSPRFYPAVRKAELIIPSLKHIGDNRKPGEIKYADAYLKFGLSHESNNGQLFGEFIGGIDMNFTGKADKSGGLVTPNMRISGLSRAMGPVAGDTNKIAGGKFDPKDFFGDLSPKIFGCIDLFDLIDGVDSGLANKLDLVPKFVTEALDSIEAFLVEVENFRSALQSIPDSAGLQAHVTALINDTTTILEKDMPDILKPPFETIEAKLTKLSTDLSTFSGHFTNLGNALPGANLVDGTKRKLQKNIANFNHTLADAASFINDIRAFAGVIPLELPKEIKVRFDWKPAMKNWGFPGQPPLFIAKNDKNGGQKCTLLIGVEMRVRSDGKGSPSADIICSLENFALDLIAPASFIKLYFKKLQFFAGTSKKADINVDFGGIEFVGVLSFIEALRSLIPLDGFSDPPALDVSAQGIKASFSIALPTLAVGMFSLQNMSLGAGFTIPFIGEPLSVYFNFCSRESPFLLTVAFLGGGGFFGITLDPQGVQLLEASFEFGACLAVNFFVASGSVHIMAGIYLKIEKGDGSLTGYLRIGGEVSVLGLISASIELRMELTYEFGSGKVVGRATLTIEVKIIFFTISVELTCERKFAGSNGDPSFAQLMEPFMLNGATVRPWDEYCMAFAS